jgi:hypothetical protein
MRPINRPNPAGLSGASAACSQLRRIEDLAASASELIDITATKKDLRSTSRAFELFSDKNFLLFGHGQHFSRKLQ